MRVNRFLSTLALIFFFGMFLVNVAGPARIAINGYSAAITTIYSLERAIAAGEITGCTRVGKFGYNTEVASTAEEDVHSQGDSLAFLTAATSLEILSDNAADDVGQAGCTEVTVYGLGNDADASDPFGYQTEAVDMDGTSVVALTKQWLRPYRMRCTKRGTYDAAGANTGTITLRVASAGATVNEMPVDAQFAGAGASYTTHYTVPTGKQAWLYYIIIDVESSKAMRLAAHVRTNDGNMTSAPFSGFNVHQFTWKEVGSYSQLDIQQLPFYLPPKTDVWFEARAAGTTGSVSINYGMVECDI